ncbi:MAG: hypothetical protein Fur0022_17840 [Anaerolineales bacterium]
MNEYLETYIAGVQSPKASGFEHLQTLMMRDRLFDLSGKLSVQAKARLRQADRQLLENANLFLESLEQITSLAYERQQRNVSALRWWWYLDVVVNLSFAVDFEMKSSPTTQLVTP